MYWQGTSWLSFLSIALGQECCSSLKLKGRQKNVDIPSFDVKLHFLFSYGGKANFGLLAFGWHPSMVSPSWIMSVYA